jgi:hypothetical protein
MGRVLECDSLARNGFMSYNQPGGLAPAEELFRHALTLDPVSADACWGLGAGAAGERKATAEPLRIR